jgi:hypothetical protein
MRLWLLHMERQVPIKVTEYLLPCVGQLIYVVVASTAFLPGRFPLLLVTQIIKPQTTTTASGTLTR